MNTPYVLAIALRVVVSLSTRTFFQPDEYFQCLEPAHKIAFGYGQLTWEWASSNPIRSVAYPAIWALLFRFLALIGADSDKVIVSHIIPPFREHKLNGLSQATCSKVTLGPVSSADGYLHLQARPGIRRKSLC